MIPLFSLGCWASSADSYEPEPAEERPFEFCGGAFRLEIDARARPGIRAAMARWNELARRDGYFHEDPAARCSVVDVPLDPGLVSYHNSGTVILDLARIEQDGFATVENAMLHELGHVLGLPHVETGNVMASNADMWPADFGRMDRALCFAIGFCR